MSNHNQFPDGNSLWISIPAQGEVPDLTEFPQGYPGELLEGEAAANALQGYEDAGKHLRPLGVDEDESFATDRALFDRSYGLGYEFGVIRDRLDPAAVEQRTRLVGRYDVNNLSVAFVDETGRLNLLRATGANVKALHGANYMKGEVPVPFSNSEQPIPGSLTDLHLQLFAALSEQDEIATGEMVHTMDLIDPFGYADPAVMATRGLTYLQSEASSDYRETREMDPEAAENNAHTVQSLRDQIALAKMAEMME